MENRIVGGIKERYMKKILIIVEAMGGGVFTYIVDFANELTNYYEVYVAYAVREQTPLNHVTYFDSSIHLMKVEKFGRSLNILRDMQAYQEMRKIEQEVQPDIIHLHSSKAGALGRVAFCRKQIPLFYTPHGYSFLMENHSPLKRILYHQIEKYCGKLKCTTISCSEGEHLESLKLNKNPYYVNNSVNIELLKPYSKPYQNTNSDKLKICTIGRICYQKNPELFNQIASAFPQHEFIWIGDGNMRDVLTASNIVVTGWLNRHEVLELANESDVFLLVSRWEGMPISLLEAMYLHKLCIVSNVIGNRDVIHNGKNGYACNNLEEFIQVIGSKELFNQQYIESAYHDVLETYNTKNMVKQYCYLYSSWKYIETEDQNVMSIDDNKEYMEHG